MTNARRRRRAPQQRVDREAPDFSLAAVIDTMRVEHVQCRDFGHSWRPYTAARLRGGGYESTLRCSRCRTLRKRTLGNHGQVLASSYEYPEQYIILGLGRLVGEEKDHLRLASIQHVLVEDTAEDEA